MLYVSLIQYEALLALFLLCKLLKKLDTQQNKPA